MYLLYCKHCKLYTLKGTCPKCNKPTDSAHPARFSPDDKYSNERIKIKKRYGLLPVEDKK